MNPILPLKEHVPDVEAKVFSDGRIYLYGSYDLPGNTEYCSKDYYVFSSDDFLHFEKSDVALSIRQGGIPFAKEQTDLYAPDCLEKDGRYYLYFCTSDGGEGVAESEHPMGPFENPRLIEGVHPAEIDPTVFEDEDGSVYYYWGQFKLKGAKLHPSLHKLDPDTYQPEILTEQEHGFHEGASICKRNGIYYLVYTDISRGRATCLAYATSKSPLGPFQKRGILIDNTGCDPASWNNHGSICEIRGWWYVFYHRSTHNSYFSRRVCVEPIYFEEDGSIREVEMTVNGQEERVESTRKLEASRASRLKGSVYIEAAAVNGEYQEYLTKIKHDDWAEYRYLDFQGETRFFVEAGSFTYGGVVELHLDHPDGPLIGSVQIGSTDGWNCYETFSCRVKPVTGRRALYLKFKGDANRLFDITRFWFEKSNEEKKSDYKRTGGL